NLLDPATVPGVNGAGLYAPPATNPATEPAAADAKIKTLKLSGTVAGQADYTWLDGQISKLGDADPNVRSTAASAIESKVKDHPSWDLFMYLGGRQRVEQQQGGDPQIAASLGQILDDIWPLGDHANFYPDAQ